MHRDGRYGPCRSLSPPFAKRIDYNNLAYNLQSSPQRMAENELHNCEYDNQWLIGGKCDEEPFKERDGRRYCVLHYPGPDKQREFDAALERRLNKSDAKYLDLNGVWFPDYISFEGCDFRLWDFTGAVFNSSIDFNGRSFKEVLFLGTQFTHDANFEGAHFSDGDFSSATFSRQANFRMARFGFAAFRRKRFKGLADFAGAEFENTADFNASQFEDIANFSVARIVSNDRSEVKTYRTKLHDAYFVNTVLKIAGFHQACFSGIANFQSASFCDYGDFSDAEFNRADFSRTRWKDAYFEGAFFLEEVGCCKAEFMGNAHFGTARFQSVDFTDTIFGGYVDFTLTRFNNVLLNGEETRFEGSLKLDEYFGVKSGSIKISFDKATFKEGLTLRGNELYQDKALVTFDDANFDKPQRVKFQSVSMPPHSFMNVDPRKFHFADVRWGFIDKRTALRDARAALANHERVYSAPMLELAYRQLAVNAEENNRYEEAANLRYLAMEVARSMRWRRIDWLRLSWWYWLLSGYGERVRRAFAALIIIWLAFALTYWAWRSSTWWQPKQSKTSSVEKADVPITLTLPDALLYSANVMALQKPEPLPANRRAKVLVLAETIFGPLQAALLALAIRRKFMR